MDFVLDTNILVYFVRNDQYIRQLDSQFSLFSSENATFVSIVSVGEIRTLAYQFGWGYYKSSSIGVPLVWKLSTVFKPHACPFILSSFDHTIVS